MRKELTEVSLELLMAAVEKVNEVPAPTDPVLVIASDGLAVQFHGSYKSHTMITNLRTTNL